MKASVTRYPGEDGEEDQFVIRLDRENACILLEILGSADQALLGADDEREEINPGSITSGDFFKELRKQLTADDHDLIKFYLHDNNAGDEGIDFVVCRSREG